MENIERRICSWYGMAKKVLIIAYCFPPLEVIGSRRPYGFARYLRCFDWQPIVLTIKHPGNSPAGIEVITTDFTDRIASIKRMMGLRDDTGIHQQLGLEITKKYDYSTWRSKVIKFMREVVAFPDDERGWYRHAVDAASEKLCTERVDAIVSTSFPVTSHLIARKLKQKYGIPWVADLRDLWTQNHYYNKFNLIRLIERRLEIKTLSDADALVTVSRPLADMLGSLHAGKDILCITNGYDPEDFGADNRSLTKKFTITYTGRLYNGLRDPLMLFKVAAKLIAEGKIDGNLIEIRIYGKPEEWLRDDIRKFALEKVVGLYGFISREEAIEKQKESQLLLLLLWNDEKEEGVYTGKLFEYLGSKRPIIALGGGNSIVRELLESTNSGHFAENEEQLEDIVLRHYRDFVESGEIKCNSNQKIEDYAYGSLAERYSMLLDKVARPQARNEYFAN